MKNLLLLPFLFFSILLYPQTKQDTSWKARINKIEDKLSTIDKQNTVAEIVYLKDKLDFQQKMSEQTINSVSVQLSAASNNLTLFGILFTIAAIVFGFYVTHIERKIVNIGEKNKEMLAKSQKIKEDVDAVNQLIQSDIHKLYTQIKREETDYILDRLVKAPKEIREVSYTLLSRELLSEDFLKLRQAYVNFDKHDSNYTSRYKDIFIRQFLAQTLKDEELRKAFSGYIVHIYYYTLESEVIRAASDLATVLVDRGIQEYKIEINRFFQGLTISKFRKSTNVYQIFFQNLRSRKYRFETFDIIESTKDNRCSKIEFGNLLFNHYSTNNPTESELLSFKELEEQIAAQQNDEEEARQKLVQKEAKSAGSS